MARPRSVRAETNDKKIQHSYEHWINAVFETDVLRENLISTERKGWNVTLMVAGESESLTVQFPGSNANKLTAIGDVGQFGILLRQSYSNRSGGGVRPPKSGLEVVRVQIDGPPDRNWHVVADLNQEPEEIALQTARTAMRWVGRDLPVAAQSKRETASWQASSVEAASEKRGVIVRTAHDVQVFAKKHAEIWGDLKKEAETRGLTCRKLKSNGFETDMVICSATQRVLVEIKTSAAKADIYCAIGQLTVYPRVMCGLANHDRVLLVPETPSSALLQVLKELGITMVTYTPSSPKTFAADLWDLFGGSRK